MTDSAERSRWFSFDTEPGPDLKTLNSFMADAHEAGWTGTIRKTAAYMFASLGITMGDNSAIMAQLEADQKAAAAAPEMQAPPIQPDQAPPRKLRVVSAASFAGKPKPVREEIIAGLMPAKIVAALYGDGGGGKSLLALMFAVCVVMGRLFLGRPVRQGPAVVLCCEDDEDEVHRRLGDICAMMQIDIADLADLHIVPLIDAESSILGFAQGNSNVLQITELYNQVAELCRDVLPELLICDTLSDVFAGNENDRMLAKQFGKLVGGLVRPHGGTGLVLAHPSVDGMRSGRGTSGSTGWNNTFR
jgi:hypothetical protein